MLKRCGPSLAWWNFQTERKVKYAMMYGGCATPKATNSYHKVYMRKFRRNAFPNRRRQHWNVAMAGLATQRPQRVHWPYDITTMIFNQATIGSDKIGYVVGTSMMKTAVVAAQHLVYYPKFNQRVARAKRLFAHDEDLACVEGDLVHIKRCRRISRYKYFYVFSILEPNIEARERLKLGLVAVPPPLFGYPNSRKVVKLNLTKQEHTKQKLASAIQEQVQDFYRYGGSPMAKAPDAMAEASFDEANKMIGANAPETSAIDRETPNRQLGGAEEFTDLEQDNRQKKGEEYWTKLLPKESHDVKPFMKSP